MGSNQGAKGFLYVVIVNIGGPQQDGPLLQMQGHIGLHPNGARQVPAHIKYQATAPLFWNVVDGFLYGRRIQGGSIGFDAKQGGFVIFGLDHKGLKHRQKQGDEHAFFHRFIGFELPLVMDQGLCLSKLP